ncbi:hypothetical protein N0B51_02155 [Tsuneonella sp. YG55]|uniref:Uncharacterized protein n=1 Tax=Tsuneonella litorea TaxID=2976475 RepID=A0A9X3AKF7_9SPHN|nr:hypothetical protein [Tsuneonella litorea]MCT2557778.1 hypothetical protein [Tsuneonella litorea]
MASGDSDALGDDADGPALYGESGPRVWGIKGENLRDMLLDLASASIGGDIGGQFMAISSIKEMLDDLEPENAIEALLLSQMMTTCMTSLRLIANAQEPGRPLERFEKVMNQALKLQNLFLRQLDAWEKLRGKGKEQKITVEHVTVGSGGQAIVGHVQTSMPVAETPLTPDQSARGRGSARDSESPARRTRGKS